MFPDNSRENHFISIFVLHSSLNSETLQCFFIFNEAEFHLCVFCLALWVKQFPFPFFQFLFLRMSVFCTSVPSRLSLITKVPIHISSSHLLSHPYLRYCQSLVQHVSLSPLVSIWKLFCAHFSGVYIHIVILGF